MKLIKSLILMITLSMSISNSSLAYNEPVDKDTKAVITIAALNTVVVEIVFNGENSVVTKTGTGFIIDNGFIMTNRHVIEDLGVGYSIKVTYPKVAYDIEGVQRIIRGPSVKATILDVDTDGSDLAILQPAYKRWFGTHLNFESEENIKIGDAVSTVGMPTGEWNWSYATGVIQSLKDTCKWTVGESKISSYIVNTTMLIKSGNSGGPVVNSKGNIIGIIRGRYTDNGGHSLIVQMKSIKALLERNKEKLSVDLPMRKDL